MNTHGTNGGSVTVALPNQPKPNAGERRLRRQAKALEVIKSYRPPGHPEHPDVACRTARLTHTELPGTDPAAPGLVYFLYCAGHIKIGYTTDIKQRLNDFHTHCPMPVTLLLTVRGWPIDEENYHLEFEGDRARREWFRLSLELRDFLSRNFDHLGQVLLWNAEEEARDLFRGAQQFWAEIEADIDEEAMQI